MHVPAVTFPKDKAPPSGFWTGNIVRTTKGGTGDVGIKINGENEVFTWLGLKARDWLVL